MLKKAGIVVATAAAGLLAVSPLAFAGDKGGDHDGHNGGHGKTKVEDVNHVDNSSEGLINVADNNIAVPVNVCDNQVPIALVQVPLNDLVVPVTAALGILGDANAEADYELEDNCVAEADAGDETEIDD